MYLKKSDIHYFNVDEIEIYGTFSNYKILFEGINNSNSDYIIFGDFHIYKSDKLRDYDFKVDFIKNDIKCFAFYIGKPINSRIITRDYFKVYGNAFKIFELYEIIEFIDMYVELDLKDRINSKKNNTIKRFDLAIDIKMGISECRNKHFSKLKQTGTNYYGAGGNLETYYIGAYKKRDNRGFLIRIYDKIKDIKKKQKQLLYPDYLLEDNITRIEIEFRSEVTKFINLSNLLDRSYIYNLLIKYIEKHTKLFDKIKTEDVKKLKRLNKKVNLEELKYNDILKNKYIASFLGYSKNILKIGACPVDILIKNMIISDLTLKDLVLGIKNNEFNINEYINGLTIRTSKNIFADKNNRNGDGGD